MHPQITGNHPYWRKKLYTIWHKITSRRFKLRLFFLMSLTAILWFVFFVLPPFLSGKIGLKGSVLIVGSYIVYGIIKNYEGLRYFQREHFGKKKTERKLMTARILDNLLTNDLTSNLSQVGGIRLLEDCLDIIAHHVRTFRYDKEEEKIYCNLLVEHDSEYLKVIARNTRSCRTNNLYKKTDMLAWTSLTHKRVCESGDIVIDFPSTPANKPYKSVLVIPIIHDNKAIAALSIDSSEPYHFTGIENIIETRLLTYTGLLKTILLKYKLALSSSNPN